MRSFTTAGVILVLFIIVEMVSAQDSDIAGDWLSEKGSAVITIYKESDFWYGKIVWIRDSIRNNKPVVDKKNPVDSLKGRTIKGLIILKNLVQSSKNKWGKGTIYDPENGKTYSCEVTLVDQSHLEIRGFIGLSLFGRTTRWTRVADLP